MLPVALVSSSSVSRAAFNHGDTHTHTHTHTHTKENREFGETKTTLVFNLEG